MADVIRKATNKFTKGLIMDFSPENTKNEVLTHALNATLLTFNGNEMSLLNDMGNGRVETAFLPEGYMPVGTCEYGGIIYIVSYNPLEDKSQIGCFPSPERNISTDELGVPGQKLFRTDFQDFDANGNPVDSGLIKNTTRYVLLKNDNLNPGDKFIISANKDIYNENLADLWVDKDKKHYAGLNDDPETFELVKHPIIALNIVSLEESGKIVYLNSSVRLYEVPNNYTIDGKLYKDVYKYHILGTMAENEGVYNQKVDIDDYRNTLSSGYSVFKAKTSGKLAILAELIMIDSYSVTHSVQPRVDEFGNSVEGMFDVILHTEVTPELNEQNYDLAPKLQFYYLADSLGYLQTDDREETLFTNTVDKKTGKPISIINNWFYKIGLNKIYTAVPEAELDLSPKLGDVGKFNFPKAYTYHGRLNDYDGPLSGTTSSSIYTKFTEGKYHRINKSLIMGNIPYFVDEVQAKFYYYDPSGKSYTEYDKETINTSYTYYVRFDDPIYHDAQRNEAYKNKELFKMITIPLIADEDIIEDSEVEKFLELEIETFQEATSKDVEEGKKLYYKLDDNSYATLTGDPVDGTTYYIKIVEEVMVSIGFVISSDNAKGTIYYYPDKKDYIPASKLEIEKYYDFATYPKENEPPYGAPITLYWKEPNWGYKEITTTEATELIGTGQKIYYNTLYIFVDDVSVYNQGNQLFIVVPIDTFASSSQFIPNTSYNYINGYTKPSGTYPKDDKLFLYTVSDFIPENMDSEYEQEEEDCYKYNDLKLANITIPSVVAQNGLDLPFKYSYTIVPCMNYGKLQHLAVSNTIDFSKLHAFNQSDFTTWKYFISNDLLRLTFGADVYDTYEQTKVDGLILEFYDCWGFAGSLEITDKKSYSGMFTKIIPLNSLRALSDNKITGNSQSSGYKRNINITYDPKTKTYKYGKEKTDISFNSSFGWQAIPDDDNDCGTLYSNLIYGVKTYFRRTYPDGTKEFIKKRDFFLFTLPIYNEYYNSLTDFSNIKYPELELMLTYKIKDNSTMISYVLDETIVNGFNQNDNKNVKSYLAGFYLGTSLDVTKYYKYKGTSELFLEIGLKKEYEDLNLNYDPLINSKFNCELRLISDDELEKAFTVNSGVEGLILVGQILNYNDLIKPEVNKLYFELDPNLKIYALNGALFRNSNFINVSDDFASIPIKINYEYVVGYKASIKDIRSTLVQATTICALYHKQPSGEYNCEDFGIYMQQDPSGALNPDGTPKMIYLSNVMFYNEGTAETEVFGLCKLISTTGTILELLSIITSVETEALEIKTAGKLNTGEPLKQLVGHLGKLTFCLPHAHGFSELNGVNIHGGKYNSYYAIPPDEGGGEWFGGDGFFGEGNNDDSYGIVPLLLIYSKPLYNLSLNTKNSIQYLSEFLSTIHYNKLTNVDIFYSEDEDGDTAWHTVKAAKEFTGLTGQQIATFNEKLLKTMSSVYAYNPGYDSLAVNVGNITLQDYNPYFTSNLLNQKSELHFIKENGEFFNSFINIGPISISNYLLNLYDHSVKSNYEIDTHLESIDVLTLDESSGLVKQFNALVDFLPNFDYCGTDLNKYLITSLTYNTPVPQELEQELEFSASDMNVIKHSDGTNTYLKGIPNKKVLYGYNEKYDKMILLDVSNYTIAEDGTLSLKDEGAREVKTGSLTVDSELNNKLFENSHTFTFDLSETEKIDIYLNMNRSMILRIKNGNGGTFLGNEFSTISTPYTFYISPTAYAFSLNPDSKYSVKIDSIELTLESILLNSNLRVMGGQINLVNQSEETLEDLIDDNVYLIELVDLYGLKVPETLKSYYVVSMGFSNLEANGSYVNSYGQSSKVNVDEFGNITFKYYPELGINPAEHSYVIVFIKLTINKINFTVTKTSKLESDPETFIHTTKTIGYSNKVDNKYVVNSTYQDSQIRGTSITINDLLYEPNVDGHRLFIKNNLCVYNPNLRSKLYYRFLNEGKWHDSWKYNNTKYYNNLFLFTGPCFTPDRL